MFVLLKTIKKTHLTNQTFVRLDSYSGSGQWESLSHGFTDVL